MNRFRSARSAARAAASPLRRPARATAALAALLAGALATGCGTDTEPYPTRDCCVNNVYYQCSTAAAAGRCLSEPQDPSLCTLQTGLPCPATAGAAAGEGLAP